MNIPCPDRPLDDPYVWELIELDLHHIDKSWWTILSAMAVPGPLLWSSADVRLKADYGPPPPKQPIQLNMYLHDYAKELFNAEFKHYPDDPDCIAYWAQKLAERVEGRIFQRIGEIEAPRLPSLVSMMLSYHVTHLEMRETIRECLKRMIEENVPSEAQKQKAASTGTPQIAESKEPAMAPALSEIERRKALLAEYKAATGNPSDYRIFNAQDAGLYKPEFYRWLKGTLSAHSKTAKNFERFLREKKPPIPRKPH
jgi:hypothetical protein